jgi:hypothetical protein
VGDAGEFHGALGVRFVGSKYRRCGGFERNTCGAEWVVLEQYLPKIWEKFVAWKERSVFRGSSKQHGEVPEYASLLSGYQAIEGYSS